MADGVAVRVARNERACLHGKIRETKRNEQRSLNAEGVSFFIFISFTLALFLFIPGFIVPAIPFFLHFYAAVHTTLSTPRTTKCKSK
jgi:hypothetical protein